MDIHRLRSIVEEGKEEIQWAGYAEGTCKVRLGKGDSYRIEDVDISGTEAIDEDATVIYNYDADHDDMGNNVSVYPPDTSSFRDMRRLSILGINVGGPCLPGTGHKYNEVKSCYCAYDIETDMSRNVGGGLGLVGVPIISIAARCSCGEELFLPVVAGVFTSADACSAFISWVWNHRPVWLLGYNCFTYDNMHIVHHLPRGDRCDFLSLRVGGKGSASDGSLINIPGVYNVDLYVYLMRTRESDFQSMKLAHVAEALGCSRKLAMPAMNKDVDYDSLREYNLNDCTVTLEVWIRSRMKDELPCLAVCTASHVYDSCRFVTGFMMTCGCASEAMLLNRVMDWSPCPTSVEYGGGLVLEPTRGVFDNVEVYDFKSMYPSVIIACNISPETISVRRPRTIRDDSEPDYQKIEGGCRVKLENTVVEFRDDADGLPKMILMKLVNLRQKVKKSDPPYASALKIGSNSLFGVLGYDQSDMYSPSCSSAITTVARFCLRTSVEVSLAAGRPVIYGDTDSIFSAMGKDGACEPDSESSLGVMVTQELSTMGLEGMVLAQEALYSRVVMMGKKRYCALRPDGSMKLTGISAVRQDSYGMVRQVSREIAEIALKEGDTRSRHTSVAVCCARNLDRLVLGRLSLRDASRLVKRQGKKGYLYTDSGGSEHHVPADEADLERIVDIDVSGLAESLGKEMSRFTVVCGMGNVGEAIRDHCSFIYW